MKFNPVEHVLFGTLACVPVYWACLFYIEVVKHQEIEELAVAATICFFCCVYAGRYLSQIWASYTSKIPNSFLIILCTLIIGNVVWLFIHPDYPLRTAPALNLLLYWGPFIILGTSLGVLIKSIRLSKHYMQQADSNAAHTQSELQLLQSQLSPHFLFNTLNNLYGISLTQHQKTPALLLKLSELLRYSVYEAKEQLVPLKDEIAYINNYIDFEKMRIGERLVISTSLNEFDENLKIAPMLLIVFIENAFKHSKNSTDKNIHVDIELKTWANSILFSVKNSYQSNEEGNATKRSSGLGLANAKKRLELLYPQRYDLKVECTEGLYSVMLQLKTK
jgi:hypothetical protein